MNKIGKMDGNKLDVSVYAICAPKVFVIVLCNFAQKPFDKQT